MTEPIVLGVSRDRAGAQTVYVRAGFELLGEYLESDIRGIPGPYSAARAVLEQGLKGAITLLYNEEHTGTFATKDVLQAFDEYAEHMAARARDA